MIGEIWHVYVDVKPGPLAPGVRAIRYGQTLGGRPCAEAYLHNPPRNERDREWIEQVLSLRLCPGAQLRLRYDIQEPSHKGSEVTTDE